MNRKADNYAKALLELSLPEESVSKTEELLRDEKCLTEALKNPVISQREKERVIDRIFPREMRGFLKTVCRRGQGGILFEIFDRYRKYTKEQKGILSARLIYVTPPTKAQLDGLSDFLKRRFGRREVEFEFTEDQTLLGGFILQAEGIEFDRSLRGSYRRLENYLYGGERA